MKFSRMATASAWLIVAAGAVAQDNASRGPATSFDDVIHRNTLAMLSEGRTTFRYDTFGDETWWGGTLRLHEAIEGSGLGGVGSGVSPKTALAVGLKVDVDALPAAVIAALEGGQVKLDEAILCPSREFHQKRTLGSSLQ